MVARHTNPVDVLKNAFLTLYNPNKMVPAGEQVCLSWHGLQYAVGNRTILHNASGHVPGGGLFAIMGPSGAGKTTLLNALAKRITPTAGRVTVNGAPINTSHFQHMAGYVAQDDMLMGTMTPRESLEFAARFKCPHMLACERHGIIDSLLDTLGLASVQDHYIGYTGMLAKNTGLTRGLSGGERKRVSIAYELVAQPRILFLDEPTSGLDAHSAKVVVQCLRDLAFYGCTIVMTIHQPSADIFGMFDQLALLAEGKTVYFGPAHSAHYHFASLGVQPPSSQYHINPAEFVLKAVAVAVADIRHTDNDDEELQMVVVSPPPPRRPIDSLVADYQSSRYAKKLKSLLAEELATTATTTTTTAALSQVFFADAYRPSFVMQCWILLQRSLKTTYRDPSLMQGRLFQSIVIAVFTGLTWLRLGNTQTDATDRYSSVFFVLNASMYGAINSPLYVFPSERAIFFREQATRMYSPLAYYLSKNVTELVCCTLFPFLSTTIVFWLVGYNSVVTSWLLVCAFVMLVEATSQALGMVLSCAILNMGVVLALQPLILQPIMIFSGLFINAASVGNDLTWLASLSFLKYGFRGACTAIFTPIATVTCTTASVACRFTSGQGVLTSLGLVGHPVYIDALVLCGYAAGLHLVAIVALYIQVKLKT